MWNLSSDYDFIDRYWLQFDQKSKVANALCAMFILFVGVFSIFGNGAVIYSFCKSKVLRTANAYVINMALSDVIMAAGTYWMFIVSSLKGIWYFGRRACEYYAFVQGVCSITSVVSMAAIAIERYYGVQHPVRFRKISMKTKLQVIAATWLYCVLMCLPPLMGWSGYSPSGLLTTCCFKFLDKDGETISYIIYLTTFGFVLPCCIIGYCYVKIFNALVDDEDKANERRMSGAECIAEKAIEQIGVAAAATGMGEEMTQITQREKRKRSNMVQTEIRTAKITLIVIIMFMIAWTPYSALIFVGYFGPPNIITPWPAHITSMFAKACVLYNPVIYALKDKRFQRAFKKFVLGVCFRPYRLIRVSLRYSIRSLSVSVRRKRKPAQKEIQPSEDGPEIDRETGEKNLEEIEGCELKEFPLDQQKVTKVEFSVHKLDEAEQQQQEKQDKSVATGMETRM